MLLFFSIPSVVLYKVAYTPLSIIVSYAAIVSLDVVAVLGSAALLVPRLLRGAGPETVGAAVLAAGIHNSAFLPIPLMLVLYGDAGPAALYSTIINVYIAVATPVIIGLYSPRYRGGSLAGRVARSIAEYPPVYALAAAAALRPLPGAPAVEPWLHLLYRAGAESTLASFYLVGSALRGAGLGVDRAVAAVAAWRLLLDPLTTFGLASLLGGGLRGAWLAGLYIEAFMPPATMNLVVSMLYGLDYRLVARCIGIITPLSLAAAAAVRQLVPP